MLGCTWNLQLQNVIMYHQLIVHDRNFIMGGILFPKFAKICQNSTWVISTASIDSDHLLVPSLFVFRRFFVLVTPKPYLVWKSTVWLCITCKNRRGNIDRRRRTSTRERTGSCEDWITWGLDHVAWENMWRENNITWLHSPTALPFFTPHSTPRPLTLLWWVFTWGPANLVMVEGGWGFNTIMLVVRWEGDTSERFGLDKKNQENQRITMV